MTNDIDDAGVPDDDHPSVDWPLAGLLGDPELWGATDQATEDAIVAAIAAEKSSMPVDRSTSDESVRQPGATPAPVVPLSSARRLLAPVLAGVAAALVLLAGFALFGSGGDDLDGLDVALAPTDIAPEAEAVATVAETPLGTRIVLDVSGLPPAAPGTYYEAWMRIDADAGVSAGTFHLRGGDGEIELWSGVSPEDYPLLTVTVQDEGEAASSGVVVLRGRIDE